MTSICLSIHWQASRETTQTILLLRHFSNSPGPEDFSFTIHNFTITPYHLSHENPIFQQNTHLKQILTAFFCLANSIVALWNLHSGFLGSSAIALSRVANAWSDFCWACNTCNIGKPEGEDYFKNPIAIAINSNYPNLFKTD